MKKILWNEGWKFWKEEHAFALIWSVPGSARDITLPHDAMIEEKADPMSPNGANTGFRNGGTYTYLKLFYAPEDWEQKTVLVYFEGIYRNALVYLNGQMVARNPNGYTGFYADLGRYLRPGPNNELRVQVRTGAMPDSRWYSGSGIYRDVYLLLSGKTHLAPGEVRVHTERADDHLAVLGVSTEIVNEGETSGRFRVRTEILDAAGKTAGGDETLLFLGSGERRVIRQRILVADPRRWSENSPVLYRAKVSLIQEKREESGCSDPDEEILLDDDVETFGIRTLSVDAARGLVVNGEPVKLRGGCIHHDSGILGAAVYEDAVYRQIRRMKEAGFNAVRMAHHPMAPAMLRACDDLGMFVMDEFTDMWDRVKSDYDYSLSFDACWRKDVASMVREDYNHPCVILYSIGNEIPEIGMEQGSGTARSISDLFHTLDPFRFTTAGINGVFAAGDRMPEIMRDVLIDSKAAGKEEEDQNVNDFMTAMDSHMDEIVRHPAVSERLEMAAGALDVAGYNYMTARYEDDSMRYPNRVMVGSETYPPQIARNWEEVEKLPAVIGDFTWTGWDYIGEAGVGIPAYRPGEGGFGAQFPAQLAYCGDFDLIGNRRSASFYREIAFGRRRAPYLAVQNPAHHGEQAILTPWVISDALHTWTYPGCEGCEVTVEVYGKGAAAELLLNGRSVGREKIIQSGAGVIGNRALFETVYEPGTLTAVLYDEMGGEIGRDELVTADEPSSLQAVVEPRALPVHIAGKTVPSRLFYIDFALTDREERTAGNIDFDCDLMVAETRNFRILGFGSADPKPKWNYGEGRTKTFLGRALLIGILENPEQTGEVLVRSESGMSAEIAVREVKDHD